MQAQNRMVNIYDDKGFLCRVRDLGDFNEKQNSLESKEI